MLTSAQREGYEEFMDTYPESHLPPRIVQMPDYAMREVPGSGDGTVLLVAKSLDDGHPLEDCPCDNTHVEYWLIKADGEASPQITSGSVMEALSVPESAEWSVGRPVTIDDWPVEVIAESDLDFLS